MISNQAYLFLIFVINGFIIGLLFDFFRILRRSFKTTDIITYIEDFLFWILAGIILLYSIFIFNNGEIRLFLFLGVIFGIILYMLLLSKFIIKINVKIIKFITNIIQKIINIILIPFKFLKKLFFKPISFIIINVRKLFTNIFKIFEKNTKISKKTKKSENKEGFFLKM